MRHRNSFQSHSKGAAASDMLAFRRMMYSKRATQLIAGMKSFDRRKRPSYSKILGTVVLNDSFLRRHQEFSSCLLTCGSWSRDFVWLSDFFSSESLGHCLFTWPGQGYCEPSRHLKENYTLSFFLHPPCPKAVTSRQLLAQPWICNYSCCHKNAPKREAYSVGRNSHTRKKDCQYGSDDRTWLFGTRGLYTECGWECLEPCCLLVWKILSSKEVPEQLFPSVLKPFLPL